MAELARKFTPGLLARALGSFPVFAALLTIRTKARGEVIGFGYHNWNDEQRRFWDNRTGRDVVLKARQIGFTTWCLAYAIWFAIRYQGVNVLIVVHNKKLGQKLFLTIKLFLRQLEALGVLPPTKYDNVNEIVFDSTMSTISIVEAGANEVSASEKGRSGTVHLAIFSEVAFYRAAHATMGAIQNAIPRDAEVIIESTANGTGGWYHDKVIDAQAGDAREKLHFFPWYEHSEYLADVPPGFDPAPRDKWEKVLRERGCNDAQAQWWREKVKEGNLDTALQENPPTVASAFRASGTPYISPSSIDEAESAVRPPDREQEITLDGRTLGKLLIWKEPETLRQYIIGADIAEGVGRDRSTLTVIDHETAEVCAVLADEYVSPGDFGHALSITGQFFNGAQVAAERNNNGHATLRALTHEAMYGNVYHHDDQRPGWPTNVATRSGLFDELARGIGEGSITTPHAGTLSEAQTLIRDADGKPRARDKSSATGCKDDLYVAWAIAIQVRSRHPIN